MNNISNDQQTIIEFDSLQEMIDYIQAAGLGAWVAGKLWRNNERRVIDGLDVTVDSIAISIKCSFEDTDMSAAIEAKRAELQAQLDALNAKETVLMAYRTIALK